MAFTFTFDIEAASTNANSATTGSADSTGSTFIVIAVNHEAAGAVAPTDSKGNTWTACTRYKSPTVGTQFYYCVNPTVGSGHTFTISSTGDYPSIAVIGFSTDTDAALDQQNGATSTASKTLASGSITPSANNALVVTASSLYSLSTAVSVDSPFSSNQTAALNTTGNAYGCGMAYEIQTTATARNPTWTWTTGFTDDITSIIASFTEGAAPTANQNYLTLLGVG